MSVFVEVPVTTSEPQLEAEALTKLKEELEARGIVGWTPSEADIEIILLKILSAMSVNAALVASTVLTQVFQQFGLQFLKLAFNEGVAATAKTKWTIVKEAGVRHIPQGTQIEAGGLGFYVETETEVPSEATEVTLQVVALERGTEYNKVSGVALQVNPLSYVTEVQIIGETTGGAEEESSTEYRSRLVAALQLQAPRPITGANFAAFALVVPSSVTPSGQVVGRATAIEGYNPATVEHEAKVTSGSAVMTEVANFTGVTVGTEIVGTGVPKGCYVATLTTGEEGKSELTMSAKATSSPGKKAYKFVGSYKNGGYVTVFVAKATGLEMSAEAMTDLETYFKKYQWFNAVTKVEPPSYNKCYIAAKVKVLPEYTAATVKTNVEAAIRALVSPETWGNPTKATTGSQQWLNYSEGVKLYGTLRYNQLIEAIGAVPGVAYVVSGGTGLEIGLEAGSKGTSDLQLVGPAPLPEVTSLAVTTE